MSRKKVGYSSICPGKKWGKAAYVQEKSGVKQHMSRKKALIKMFDISHVYSCS